MMRRNAGRVHVRGHPLRVAAEKLQPLVSPSYPPNQSNTWKTFGCIRVHVVVIERLHMLTSDSTSEHLFDYVRVGQDHDRHALRFYHGRVGIVRIDCIVGPLFFFPGEPCSLSSPSVFSSCRSLITLSSLRHRIFGALHLGCQSLYLIMRKFGTLCIDNDAQVKLHMHHVSSICDLS